MSSENNELKNTILLLGGRSLSGLGNIVFDYANSVLITTLGSKSNIIMAIYKSSDTIVNICLNLFGGVFSDNHNRKRILIITDFLSAIVCFVLSIFFKSSVGILVIILTNILLAILLSFNSPTYRSIIPELINKKVLLKFNSTSNLLDEVISVGAPMMGVLIMRLFSFRGAMLLDSLTFLLSAIFNIFLADYVYVDKNNKKKIFKELKEGVKYLISDKELFVLIIVATVINLFLSGYNTVVPFIGQIYNNISNAYAIALVLESVGGILGALANGFIKKVNLSAIVYSLTGAGVSSILFGFSAFWRLKVLGALLLLIFAMAVAIFNIKFMTYVQINTKKEFIGRVFSIIFTLSIILMPLGSIIFSELIGVREVMYIIIGIGMIITTLVGKLYLSKSKIVFKGKK